VRTSEEQRETAIRPSRVRTTEEGVAYGLTRQAGTPRATVQLVPESCHQRAKPTCRRGDGYLLHSALVPREIEQVARTFCNDATVPELSLVIFKIKYLLDVTHGHLEFSMPPMTFKRTWS
jgi:hypothetical protein